MKNKLHIESFRLRLSINKKTFLDMVVIVVLALNKLEDIKHTLSLWPAW